MSKSLQFSQGDLSALNISNSTDEHVIFSMLMLNCSIDLILQITELFFFSNNLKIQK
jgi:hypothetical protein